MPQWLGQKGSLARHPDVQDRGDDMTDDRPDIRTSQDLVMALVIVLVLVIAGILAIAAISYAVVEMP